MAEASFFSRCLAFLTGRSHEGGEDSRRYTLSADGELTAPAAFHLAFTAAQGRNLNVLEWPVFADQLPVMRDALPAGHAFRARVERVMRQRRLSYEAYIQLFLEVSIEISNAAGPAYRVSLTDPLAFIAYVRESGGIIVPIIRDGPLSQASLLRAQASGVFLVQLPTRPSRADGIDLSPFGFMLHDILHAHAFVRDHHAVYPGAGERPRPEPSRIDPILGPVTRSPFRLGPVVERVFEIQERNLRDDVTSVLFEWLHEHSRFTHSSFMSRLADDASGTRNSLSFFTNGLRRPGETPQDVRPRIQAVLEWLRANGLAEGQPSARSSARDAPFTRLRQDA